MEAFNTAFSIGGASLAWNGIILAVSILVAVVVYAALSLLFAMFTKEELTYIPGGRKLARFARR